MHLCRDFPANKSKHVIAQLGQQQKMFLFTRQLGLSPSELLAKRKQLAAHVALQSEQ